MKTNRVEKTAFLIAAIAFAGIVFFLAEQVDFVELFMIAPAFLVCLFLWNALS